MKTSILTLLLISFSVSLFGQNENPYKQFGYEAPIMPDNQAVTWDKVNQFNIHNTDTTSVIGMLTIDVPNRNITIYDRSGVVIKTDTLEVHSMARWFSVDPQSQFASPYLAMGNNPVLMIDPNGEIAFLAVVGIFAAVNLASDAIRGNINSFQDGAISFGLGALQGVLAASGPGGLAAYAGSGSGWLALGSAVAGQINVPIYSSDNFNLSLSPSLSAGSTGARLGANLFASATIDNVTISGGYSVGRNFSATDLSGTMAEARWSSIVSGNVGFHTPSGTYSYGLTHFGGNYSQNVGSVGYSNGRLSATMENDIFARSGDKYRTAAFRASYQVSNDVSLTGGFSIWTGAPGEQGRYTVNGKERSCYHCELESPSPMRNGNLFLGANYRGNSYAVGANSEGIRSAIQNGWHNAMGWPGLRAIFGGASPHFERMNYQRRFYSSFGSYNPFTIYGQ